MKTKLNGKKQRKHIRVYRLVPLRSQDLGEEGRVTLEDAAAFVGVSSETVRRYIDAGKIKGIKETDTFGREGWRWVLPVKEVLRLRDLRQPQVASA